MIGKQTHTKIANDSIKPVVIAREMILLLLAFFITVITTYNVWKNVRNRVGEEIVNLATSQCDDIWQQKFDDMESAASGFQFL